MSFTTVFGAPAGIAIASSSLAFLISTGILKKLLKTTRIKNKKHDKISETLINNEIINEDFMSIINDEINYCELKKSIRMINNQRNYTEKI